MRNLYRSASVAALAGELLWALSQGASAAAVSITAEDYEGNPPLVDTPTPASFSGNFLQSVTSGQGGVNASPYSGYTGVTGAAFSVLGAGNNGSPIGSATYNVNSSSFTLLWGSPDPWNQVEFFSGQDGTGSSLGTFTSTDLDCYAGLSGLCHDRAWDLVTFGASSGNIGSVVLSNADIIAFEFGILPGGTTTPPGDTTTPPGDTTSPPVGATPLPGAIYLFGSVLGGVFWLGRRKRRAVGSLGVA
jgi:hypothetical protein